MNEKQVSPLDKPLWIRVIGWLDLLCLLVPMCVPLAEVVSHVRIPRTVWPGYCFLAFFPLFWVWALASILHRMHVRRAKQGAAAMLQAALRAQAQVKQAQTR
jgi:hypothetical protein